MLAMHADSLVPIPIVKVKRLSIITVKIIHAMSGDGGVKSGRRNCGIRMSFGSVIPASEKSIGTCGSMCPKNQRRCNPKRIRRIAMPWGGAFLSHQWFQVRAKAERAGKAGRHGDFSALSAFSAIPAFIVVFQSGDNL